jgi:ribosomal protein L37AE/L43A
MIKYGDIEIWKCRICGIQVEAAGTGLLDTEMLKIATDTTHEHDMYYEHSIYRKKDDEKN